MFSPQPELVQKKDPVIEGGLDFLRKDPKIKELRYHGANHTEKDVLFEATRLAKEAGITNESELLLLQIAAVFHDAGFSEADKNNEAIGARIAKEYMEKDGRFKPEEIERVKNMIMATQMVPDENKHLVQVVTSDPLAQILQDADLANFGMEYDQFMVRTRQVFEETRGKDFNKFINFTIVNLLEPHHYRSEVGKNLHEAQKQANIARLKAEYAQVATAI